MTPIITLQLVVALTASIATVCTRPCILSKIPDTPSFTTSILAYLLRAVEVSPIVTTLLTKKKITACSKRSTITDKRQDHATTKKKRGVRCSCESNMLFVTTPPLN
jgi:hypothetical protein